MTYDNYPVPTMYVMHLMNCVFYLRTQGDGTFTLGELARCMGGKVTHHLRRRVKELSAAGALRIEYRITGAGEYEMRYVPVETFWMGGSASA